MTQKSNISMDTFLTLDIRMCTITALEKVLKKPNRPHSDENPFVGYKLTLATGFDTRECFTNAIYLPEESLLNKVLPFVLNLEPSTIRGIESKAMIVLPSGKDNKAKLDNYAEGDTVI